MYRIKDTNWELFDPDPEEAPFELSTISFLPGQNILPDDGAEAIDVGVTVYVNGPNSEQVYLVDGSYVMSDQTTFVITDGVISEWNPSEELLGDLVSAEVANGYFIKAGSDSLEIGSGVTIVNENEDVFLMLNGTYVLEDDREMSVFNYTVTQWDKGVWFDRNFLGTDAIVHGNGANLPEYNYGWFPYVYIPIPPPIDLKPGMQIKMDVEVYVNTNAYDVRESWNGIEEGVVCFTVLLNIVY